MYRLIRRQLIVARPILANGFSSGVDIFCVIGGSCLVLMMVASPCARVAADAALWGRNGNRRRRVGLKLGRRLSRFDGGDR